MLTIIIRKYKVGAIALLPLFLFAIPYSAAAQAGKAEEGQKLFDQNCAKCHGPDGSGDTAIGKAVGAKDLRAAEAQKMTDAEIYTQIDKGKGNMPPFGDTLDKAKINDLIAYVRELGKKQTGAQEASTRRRADRGIVSFQHRKTKQDPWPAQAERQDAVQSSGEHFLNWRDGVMSRVGYKHDHEKGEKEDMNDQEPQFRPAILIGVFIALFVTAFLRVPKAAAVPSYARQTGFACKSCHLTPPELTALGRAFKLNGYTMPGAATVTSKQTGKQSGLMILETLPLSVMFDASFSSTQSPQPGTQNGSFQVPQDASLFLAGAWSQHVGSFVQVTYDSQGDHFSWDNTDIRYANATKIFQKDFVYGVTLNNNPTVEDLWNSTPAWGFPWVNSTSAPTPTATAIINGALAQDVAGIGAYGMWDNHLYLAGTVYRSQHIGAPQPNAGLDSNGVPLPNNVLNIRGAAPYWRVALQETTKNNYLEVGSYGM